MTEKWEKNLFIWFVSKILYVTNSLWSYLNVGILMQKRTDKYKLK